MSRNRRKTTRKDIHLKARMLAEGLNIKVGTPPEMRKGMTLHEIMSNSDRGDAPDFDWSDEEALLDKLDDDGFGYSWAIFADVVLLEGSGLMAPIIPNPDSSLELVVHGFNVEIRENDRTLCRGRIDSEIGNRPWSGKTLSNGHKIETYLSGLSESIFNLFLNVQCYNNNANQTCKYCGLFSASKTDRSEDSMPLKALREYVKYTAEAIMHITEGGWMGTIGLTGGALPPSHQDEIIDRVEIVLSQLRETLPEKTFNDLNFVFNHYPPQNLNDLDRLKALGVNGTSFDLETATPEKFAEICPGKHAYKPYEEWLEAQNASAEVFGPYLHTSNFILVGLEPADVLVERIAERFDKGVITAPVVFMPDPNSEMADYRIPGGADWLVDTNLKIVRFYLKKIFKGPLHYLDFVLPFWEGTPLYLYNRFSPGFMRLKNKNTCRPFSSWPLRYHACLVQDEVHRRFQQFPGYLSLVQPLVDYATSNVKRNPLQIIRRNI